MSCRVAQTPHTGRSSRILYRRSKTDDWTLSVRWALDKHAPAAKRKVTNRVSSPWFSLVNEELLQAKRSRRQAERQRRASGLVVLKELYKKAKHCVTRIVMKAKSLFYNCKISSTSSTKERYSITNNLLAKTKSTPLPTLFPLPDLPGQLFTFFRDKIVKLRLDLDSQPVYTSSRPLTNPFDGSRFALSSLFLSLSLKISS